MTNDDKKWTEDDFANWLMDEIRFPELVAGWWWQGRNVKE